VSAAACLPLSFVCASIVTPLACLVSTNSPYLLAACEFELWAKLPVHARTVVMKEVLCESVHDDGFDLVASLECLSRVDVVGVERRARSTDVNDTTMH
jgi:hypothetical protein